MDAFDFNSVKVEKATAMLRFRRIRRIARLLRFVELCAALGLLSWISARLPSAVKISGEFLRQISGILVSPLFVFVVGNAIVVTLIAKSRQFAKSISNAESEFCEDLRSDISDAVPHPEPEEIVYQDKEIICEENANPSKNEDSISSAKDTEFGDAKGYRRSQSENFERETDGEMKPTEKLRRSETDICRKRGNDGEESVEELVYPEDGLSNEEFQRTIEAFIARQVKFHREESQAVVLHGQP
ncbi:hypothetical protein Nepgr_008335 [Nepenthes gracilis]|uniref:Uncharacterized protein n=1 Tax=Nepenthes gracilis TaxID=150966 RepID=A0AAD3XJA3_NEPGR|nr:hypothetical protein Nepgr_008335 [Nepenthes gracilis]